MQLTHDDKRFLQSLSASELEACLNDIAQTSPTVAHELRQQLFKNQATRQEVADFFGVAVDTIDLWKRKGCPYEGITGVESKYDLEKVAKWLAHQKVIQIGGDDLQDQKLKAERLKLAEIKRKQLEGSLIDRNQLMGALVSWISLIRKGTQRFQRNFGDEAVEQLNELLDETMEAIERDFT